MRPGALESSGQSRCMDLTRGSGTYPGRSGHIRYLDFFFFDNHMTMTLDSKKYTLMLPFYTDWSERRGNGSCLPKSIFLCRMDECIISSTKTTAIDLAQGMQQEKCKFLM